MRRETKANKDRPLLIAFCRNLGLAISLCFFSADATAQEPAARMPDPLFADLIQYHEEMLRVSPMRPTEFYAKGGPVFPLGGGLLNDGLRTGWTTQAGVRVPFVNRRGPLDLLDLFGDLGASFADNRVKSATIITAGTFYAPNDSHVHGGDYFDSEVTDLQRASVHAAIGGYLAPPFLNGRMERTVTVSLRAGARLGTSLLSFEPPVPRPELLAIESSHLTEKNPDGTAKHNPATYQTTPLGIKDDTFFYGFFSSVGIGVTCHNLGIGWFCVPQVTFGTEVEFAVDSINVSGSGDRHRWLGTVTPAFNMTFAF